MEKGNGKKHHPHEYKEYVAKLVVEENRKISDLSYELEISSSAISRWVAKYKEKLKANDPGQAYTTPSVLKP